MEGQDVKEQKKYFLYQQTFDIYHRPLRIDKNLEKRIVNSN
jgi:hypothetical protein